SHTGHRGRTQNAKCKVKNAKRKIGREILWVSSSVPSVTPWFVPRIVGGTVASENNPNASRRPVWERRLVMTKRIGLLLAVLACGGLALVPAVRADDKIKEKEVKVGDKVVKLKYQDLK